MADVKISALIDATLPVVATEVLPLVQAAGTRKVTVRDVAKVRIQDILTDATTAKTLDLADVGSWIRFTSVSAITLNIPTDATVAFPIGQMLNGVQAAAGQISFTPEGGVTLNLPANYNAKTRSQGSTWCVIKVATDTWDLFGDLELT